MNTTNNMDFNTKELETLFKAIGLANDKGENYTARLRKHKQVYDFILHLNKAVSKLSTKREIILVDCACGKSYLSFVANYFFTHVKKRNVKFYCIDYNEHVIAASQKAADELGFTNMEFICNDIFKVDFKVKPDVVYSLHACDTATDMTIAKGVLEDANFIMTVSCCQHTVRDNMKKHGLGSITKHGIYKERMADMVADSMRTLLLESKGYKVSLFEYVPASETPKNIMIRATRIGSVTKKKHSEAMDEYKSLKTIFNVSPKLNTFIEMKSANII